MKRIAILLALTALLAVAPSAFACWKCDTTQGCYGTDVGVPGRTICEFDGACHMAGFCAGFVDDTPLAASYTVAAVHVVEVKTDAKTPEPKPAETEKQAEVTR